MTMKIDTRDFLVREGEKTDLARRPTQVEPVSKSRDQYAKVLADHVTQLSARQQLLYASNRHAVLLIFQAMDAAGKDGTIRHVMSGVNPQCCQVFSFKHRRRERARDALKNRQPIRPIFHLILPTHRRHVSMRLALPAVTQECRRDCRSQPGFAAAPATLGAALTRGATARNISATLMEATAC
jgi:hypothetical protein